MATEKEMEIVEGSVEEIEFKPNRIGKEFVTVGIQQGSFEHLTRVRSTNPDILGRIRNAKKHLDTGETVHLGVEVTKTPVPNGNGYFRDIVRITSASIGDVAQEPPTPGSSPSAAPTSAPDDEWGTMPQRIAWNSAVNNSCSAIPWKENFPNAEWLNQVDTLAQDVYALIRRGPLPPEEDTPDADQPEESDDGVFEA